MAICRRVSCVALLAVLLLSASILQKNDVQGAGSDTRGELLEPGQGKPMLLDLGAGTCLPCRKMQPILEKLRKEYEGRIIIQIVDVYEHPNWARKYLVYMIPTQIFFDAGGKEVYSHIGFMSREDILAAFEKLGWI